MDCLIQDWLNLCRNTVVAVVSLQCIAGRIDSTKEVLFDMHLAD